MLVALLVGEGIVAGEAGPSPVVVLALFFLALALISIFRSHFNASVSDWLVWTSIALGGAALIAFFAVLHQTAGIMCSAPVCPDAGTRLIAGAAVSVDSTWATALYFSIVTFTTLGYGDFQPQPQMRLIAAAQAIYGYLYLGLVVGLLIDSGARNGRT